MAKTTSQIIAENKIKRAEAAAISASRDKINQQQMAGVAEKSTAKTLAVLTKAISGTSDPKKKSELSRAAQMVTDEYEKFRSQQKSGPKTAMDMQKKKEDRIEEKNQIDSLQIKKDRAQKALDDFYNNKEIDWTDTNQRKAYDAEIKRLQAEADHYKQQMDAEENQRIRDADMKEIDSMSEEDREQLRQYISSDSKTGNLLVNSNPLLWFKENQALGDSAKYLFEKYGEEKTKQLASSYSRYLNEKEAENIKEDTKNAVDESIASAVGHNILGIGTRLFGGLQATADRFREALDRDERYSTLAPINSGDLISLHGNTVTAQTAQNIAGDVFDQNGLQVKDGGILRQGAAYLYQGGMTMVDSFARVAAGGGPAGAAAIAACNSFSQTVSQASQQGAAPDQAYKLGTAVAGIEYLSEKIPMDEVFKLAKAGKTKVLAQAFRQAGIEISTEELSLLCSMAAEAAILREKSSYKQQIGDLVANGVSYEDAKKQADNAVWEEVKQTAFVSGFSGFFSGDVGAIVGNLTAQPEAAAEIAKETSEGTPVVGSAQPEPTPFLDDAAQQLAQEAPFVKTETEEYDGLTDAQRYFLEAEKARNAQPDINKALQQTADEYSDKTPVPEPEVKTAEQAGLDAAIQRTMQEQMNRKGEREVYEALKAAKKEQKDLQKEIDRAERRLAETGKGSKARIDQLRGKLEQQNDLVRQLESQNQYFTGDYERTVGEAVRRQETIFADAKARAAQAISDFEAGRITEAQKNAEVDAYNRAGAELMRLMGMTQEQYRADLAEAGLIADTENMPALKADVQEGTGSPGVDAKSEEATESAPDGGMQADAQGNTESYTPDADLGASGQAAQVPPNTENPVPPNRSPAADTQNVPAEDGQQQGVEGIKGTGAAEAGFSQKPAYNATLSEENSQADRADDARPMELPKEDVNGGKVSGVTGNVYGSKITPDDFASLMEEPTARGDFSYIPISNDRATELAKQSIERSGDWEKAYVDWAKAVAGGRAGAEMSARGAMLLNKAAQDGNKGRWMEILSDMQSLGTNTAQGLQAFRLIRTLSPPDKLEFAKMTVKKMVESMRLRTEITIDETLLNEYENAQTDSQRDEIIGRIQQNVADQIPSTFMDKFNALRYLKMLGNLKTNVQNVTGNIGVGAAYRAKDAIAAGLERVAHALSGGKTELTKSVFVNADMKKAAAKDFAQFAGVVSDGGKFSLNGNAEGDFARGVMDKRTIFKTKPLEAARKATNWAMNNGYFGDEAFGRAAYARALAGYLQANGVKETDFSKIDQALLNKARTYAVKQAQEATFHDNNKVSATLVKLQKDTGLIGQGILPFAKTPANVLVRAEEFSPLGFINSTVKSIQKAAGNTGLTEQNGLLGNFARAGQEITGADLIDSWAKSFTGAGLFVLGAWLSDNGILIGAPDEDEDKAAFDRLNGIQPFSMMLPGGDNITIDFLSPIAMTMFMGAEFQKIWAEGGDFTWEKMEKIATSMTEILIQMSMLQGVDNTLNDIKYADNNLGQFVINACVSYLAQGLTSTLGGQIERAFEKERMTTYVDKDSGVPVWMQKQLGKMSQKIPGWDYQQTAYIDARGQTQKNMEGVEGMLYSFASPGYIDKKEIDAVSAELYRLNDSASFEGSIFPDTPATSFDYTGKDGTVHKGFNLSAEQADTLKRVTGQTGTRILSGMMQSKDYAALTDTQKAEAVKLAYQYAQKKGRGAALEDYPEMSGWMAGIEGKEERAILQKVAKDTLQSAVSDWAEALKNGWSTEGDAAEIDGAYQVYQSMSLDAKKNIEDKLTGDAAAYLEIRSGGVTTEKYMDVVTGVKALKPEPTYTNVRDIQVREEIAENRKLSDREKDIVMKAYMPDYDPKAKSPKTTELKYDAIRDMGVSPKEYTDAYRIYLDASGNGKRRRTIRKYMEVFGYSRKVAEKLYDIYAGYYKPWEE